MSIQRSGYRISVFTSEEDPTKGAVTLEVEFNGKYEDQSDALLMIADAWDDAMKVSGLDPLKSLMTLQREGTLQ